MAASKEPKTTRLTHSGGATVVVDADKAEALVAGGNFSKPSGRSSAKSDS